MKLFGFNNKLKAKKFKVTQADSCWVYDNFKWLLDSFGYPSRDSQQFLFSNMYFPRTYASEGKNIQAIIEDVSILLQINDSKIHFEILEDLRDLSQVPYGNIDEVFEVEMIDKDGDYQLYIPKSTTNNLDRLLYGIIYECVKIRLIESRLGYDSGNDTNLFIYIAGIYFGFGVLLAQNLISIGREVNGMMELTWCQIAGMPYEVMALGLATYTKLLFNDNPDWKDKLPQALQSEFDLAITFLNNSKVTLANKDELEANDLANKAYNLYAIHDFRGAIEALEQVLLLTNDDLLKAQTCNNIGYYQSRIGQYNASILNYHKALNIAPTYGYALDNMGYALIQTGDLVEGKAYLEKALTSPDNDNAYTYRNLGLFYWRSNDLNQAQKYFEMAFAMQREPVDLLEFLYASFCFSIKKEEVGMMYLQKAVEKGEPEAVELLKSL